MSTWKPNIFEYLDYRRYLQDYYDAAKKNVPAFSYRYFARRAKVSSPSFLRHVMRGERHLSGTVDQVAHAIGFDEAETRYFQALVVFNQANGADELNQAFEEVAAMRRFRSAKRMGDAMFTYLSHWYYPAIREMAAHPNFQEDPEWIANRLVPCISAAQAQDALTTLEELELLTRENGKLVRGESSVTTEHEVHSLGIGNYHRQMLQRAGESIELVDREFRDLAAMTVCVSPETIHELKKRVHAFRELIFEICERDKEPQIVFQINTQLFPLSEWNENE